jgi:hypothetical protein
MSNDSSPDDGAGFPCASLSDALPYLRRPPSPTAVRFKVQTPADDAGQVVAYVDARLVYDRLDHVCGERWAARFGPLPRALVPRRAREAEGQPPLFVRCRLTVCGVTREDVGEGVDPKAAFSDAVKRAAVQFGLGRVLDAMRAPWLRAGDGDGELRHDGRGVLFVDERTEAWCREMYERWLEERGVREFGEPLVHGSTAAATSAGHEDGGTDHADEEEQPPRSAPRPDGYTGPCGSATV